jgi:hypothetical protein
VTKEQVKLHDARVAHFNAATRISRELLMLEAGHIGVHRMTCDLAMDPDERDRWGRERTTAESTIARLNETIAGLMQKVVELEAQLAAKNSTPHAPREESLSRSERSTILAPREEIALVDESRIAQTTPALNQELPDSEVASPIQNTPSGNLPDSPPPAAQKAESEESPVPPAPRWSDEERQEALDYFCQIHNLPRATLAQTSGIPNYRNITPLEAIKRGFPCMIWIDRTEENEREWNRREWERKERLKRQPF